MSVAFLLTTLIVVVSPGTGAIYTMSAGLSRGWRASLVAAFGCTLGILPHIAAAMLGLAAVLRASPMAFDVVKYAGVLYLLYLAWGALREGGALQVERVAGRRSNARVIRDAILVNILNPKLAMFFVAFLPQFIAADDPHPMLHMAGLSAVFMAVTLVVFALYGGFAAVMRDQVMARPRVLAWMRRSFAAAFAGLAVKLALASR
jgi:threonine/homoserine/homoserine lactone efflux protein